MKRTDAEKYRFPIFRERFRELQGNMSNTEFAEFLGISRQTVGFYCNGERIPDALGVRAIAEKCNVSADWLLGLSKERSPDIKIQEICKETGLSELAVYILRDEALEKSQSKQNWVDVLNDILTDTSGFSLLYSITWFKSYLMGNEKLYKLLLNKFDKVDFSNLDENSKLDVGKQFMMAIDFEKNEKILRFDAIEYFLKLIDSLYKPQYRDKFHERFFKEPVARDIIYSLVASARKDRQTSDILDMYSSDEIHHWGDK